MLSSVNSMSSQVENLHKVKSAFSTAGSLDVSVVFSSVVYFGSLCESCSM